MTTPYDRALAAGDLDDRKGGRFWGGALDRLRRVGARRSAPQRTFNNGAVANPIKGTKVGGSANINGGAL